MVYVPEAGFFDLRLRAVVAEPVTGSWIDRLLLEVAEKPDYVAFDGGSI